MKRKQEFFEKGIIYTIGLIACSKSKMLVCHKAGSDDWIYPRDKNELSDTTETAVDDICYELFGKKFVDVKCKGILPIPWVMRTKPTHPNRMCWYYVVEIDDYEPRETKYGWTELRDIDDLPNIQYHIRNTVDLVRCYMNGDGYKLPEFIRATIPMTMMSIGSDITDPKTVRREMMYRLPTVGRRFFSCYDHTKIDSYETFNYVETEILKEWQRISGTTLI